MKLNANERREKVSLLLAKGMTEVQIADKLRVSRQTIVRDVAFLKEFATNWLDDLAKYGFIFEYKLGLDSIKDNISNLEKLYNETSDPELKRRLLGEKRTQVETYLKLLGGAPIVHALKKILETRNVRAA